MQTKKCKKCNRILPENQFYLGRQVCSDCVKRRLRRKRRIENGKPIQTVAMLIEELSTLPQDAQVVLFDDVSIYRPVSVEMVRTVLEHTKYDTKEYDNIIVID